MGLSHLGLSHLAGRLVDGEFAIADFEAAFATNNLLQGLANRGVAPAVAKRAGAVLH